LSRALCILFQQHPACALCLAADSRLHSLPSQCAQAEWDRAPVRSWFLQQARFKQRSLIHPADLTRADGTIVALWASCSRRIQRLPPEGRNRICNGNVCSSRSVGLLHVLMAAGSAQPAWSGEARPAGLAGCSCSHTTCGPLLQRLGRWRGLQVTVRINPHAQKAIFGDRALLKKHRVQIVARPQSCRLRPSGPLFVQSYSLATCIEKRGFWRFASRAGHHSRSNYPRTVALIMLYLGPGGPAPC
jgi:hypothetical protein